MGREKRIRLSEKELEIVKETKKELNKKFPFLRNMALGSFISWMCYKLKNV